MTVKSRIVEHLGEAAVLLPMLIQQGLAGNDRAKFRLTALQSAVRHAADPSIAPDDLGREAVDLALADDAVARLIGEARLDGADRMVAPGAAGWLADLLADVEAMVRAAEAGGDPLAPVFRQRLALLDPVRLADGDVLRPSDVAAMTSAAAHGGDSLHRLVMDLHKALNRLAAGCADRDIDGAHSYGLDEADVAPVAAFMRGVNATRKLKFDHPGLDTTAARAGNRLVIQNDIGTTDAHVLVVSVEDLAVKVTYTDVHRARARFFVGLFDDDDAEWTRLTPKQEDGLAENEAFYLVTGRLAASSAQARDRFLEHVGAALVFLIDWNKARKTLQAFLDKAEAIAVLDWAARQKIGHRGFLALGGAELINGVIRRTASSHIGYGVRLDAALGHDGAADFLKAVLRIAAEGLLAGRADRLIHDALDADLARRLERSENELLHGALCQAGLAREIAAGLAGLTEGVRADGLGVHDAAAQADVASRAKRIEEKADRLALDLRAIAHRLDGRDHGRDNTRLLIDTLEDAIDDLEEAAFLFSLVPQDASADALGSLNALCLTAVAGAEAVARATDAATTILDGHRTDTDDALEAIADLTEAEHAADRQERDVLATALACRPDGGEAFALIECARKIERATDRFARAGHLLRAHVLGDLGAGRTGELTA